MPKVNPNQKPLFDTTTEPQNLPLRAREAVAEDLITLDEVTDATREEIELKEIEQLGTSALSDEVQIADTEDLRTLEEITDDELKRIEAVLGQSEISRRAAESIVLGEKRAAKLNGEEYAPRTDSSKKPREKSSYPGRNSYKGKTRSGKHPVARSRRQDMIGESDWKAAVHYGPKK